MNHIHAFSRPGANVFLPDGIRPEPALARTTDLIVVAHADDAEFGAIAPILGAYDDPDRWVCVCVCTDGGRSPRSGPYADVTDVDMVAIRRREQREAAVLGRYGSVVQLAHRSDNVLGGDSDLRGDLSALLSATRPAVVHTHEPADSHPTHVAVSLAGVRACRDLPASIRPARLLGCAGWRSLDWVPEDNLVRLDVSGHDDFATSLLTVFDSQISGGKRYDLAATGRRRADATLTEYDRPDSTEQVVLALDMTPLLDPETDVRTWLGEVVDRFRSGVLSRVRE